MQTEILELLQIDLAEYATMQYEAGLAYLRAYIPTDPQGMAALERSRIFWNWWKNHWNMRDMAFMFKVNQFVPVEGIRAYYRFYNDPEKLAQGIYPNAAVLTDSYAVMIDDFNNATRQTQGDIKTKTWHK
jgi:hypothetical protein